jgi:hypothetical protein
MYSTEMVIRVANRQYFATLLVDGEVSRRTVLDKWPEMAVWAHRVQQELGANIYAHLKNVKADEMQTTLALARFLDSEGFIVGIQTEQRHCPKHPLRLQ